MASFFILSKLSRGVGIAVAVVALQGNWSSAKGDVPRPTLHELAAIEARGGPRLWYHEEEFGRDPLLRAEPHQVVMLHLEAGDRKGKTIRNTIPYRFTEAAEFRFCIPKDEPHIRSIELRREGGKGNGVEVQLPRGAGCKTRTIPAGLYRLRVEHDGSKIPSAGKKAFVQVPRVRSTSLSSTVSDPFSCDALSAIMTPNGNFVVRGGGPNYNVQAPTSSEVDLLHGGWQLCRDGNGDYTLALPQPGNDTGYINSISAVFPAPGNLGVLINSSSRYQLTDLGNYQFTMAWVQNSATHNPIVVGSDTLLHWMDSGAPATFTIPVKYYMPGTQIPALQAGEVALFHGCNDDTSHGTWVVRANLPSANVFYNNPFLGTTEFLNENAAGSISVRVGPGTVASFYLLTDYRAETVSVGGDACAPISAFSSIKVTPSREFVVATNRCLYCNLSGVDLSGLDLSGGWFTGSIFAGANLAATNLTQAFLERASFPNKNTNLTGATFSDAWIGLANFRAADLSQANFRSTGISDIAAGNTYRVDLSYATLDLDTFLVSDWRLLNLSNAIINRVTGATLSTAAQPVDFSGAVLKNVKLTGVKLDGAKLGCSIDPYDESTYCTQLINTDLNNASLKRVNFSQAILQGANLNFTNLDGANLCAAKLNQSDDQLVSASLQGAFLRNVNLSQADLTGASFANANFYSSAPSSAATCNPASCGFSSSCASAVGAHLGNTDFTDAYLAGVDFSGSFPQSANFTGATLSGSNFTNANLTQDTTTGKRTNFTETFLQGTIFTNAVVSGANFSGAVVDLTHSTGQGITEQLDPATHIAFPGYTPWSGSTLGCVQFTTKRETVLPQTDSSNICPNSGSGPCTSAQWQAIAQPPPPVCNIDFNWIFATY